MSDLIVVDATPTEQKLIDEIERLTDENKVLREDVLSAQDASCEAHARVEELEAVVEAYEQCLPRNPAGFVKERQRLGEALAALEDD